MAPGSNPTQFPTEQRSLDPFRRAVLRGLAILLPPLLTIVILLWVGNTVADYLLVPLEDAAEWVMVEKLADIRTPDEILDAETVVDGVAYPHGAVVLNGETYPMTRQGVVTIDEDTVLQLTPPRVTQLRDNRLIPREVHDYVAQAVGRRQMPATPTEVYTRYVSDKWLARRFVVPVFLCVFILVLYSLGKFLAAGVGRFFWNQAERLIHRLPIVRNVYSSVKQVTDFMFSDSEMEYTRVVAVEYPRKGVWSLAMVTGESMLSIRNAAGEPVLSVLIPTSPAPFTGFTITVKKSETIDLNITVDQAFQFIVSCGVVVPPQQLAEALAKRQGESSRVEEPLALSAPVGSDD